MPDAADALNEHPRFRVIRKIGAGGMGVVYEAYDTDRDVHVALKLLPAADPHALLRFKNEFRSIAAIVHPNLVPLYELISDGDQWFFTMELIDGVEFLSALNPFRGAPIVAADGVDSAALTREISSVGRPGARVPEDAPAGEPVTPDDERRLRRLFGKLAQCVAYLHGVGVVHRDLKPSNVLVRPDGEPVVLDFGLAASLRADRQDEEVVGTLPYMAPEQILGQLPTPAVDWYAVGVMLYQALTGVLPFRGAAEDVIARKLSVRPPPPCALVPSVPHDLNQLCVDLLARDPEDRPSGLDVAARLSAEGGASVGHTATFAAGELPLIGRERPLAELHALLGHVADGLPVTVHLHGHSGMGKSALLARFLEDATARRDTVVLSGRCFEQESMPFKALDSLMDRLAYYLRELSFKEVSALMPPDVAALSLMFPALRSIPAVERAPQDVLAIPERRELRQRAFAALRGLLKRLGDTRVLVLSIDDLQWGDTDSAAFLDELLGATETPKLMLLVAYRTEHRASACVRALTESTDRRASRHEWRTIEVAPLDRDETRRLVTAILPDATPQQRERIERIAVDSGGSPYFAVELARGLGDEAQPDASGTDPTTLDEVLWRRAQRLPDAAIRLLEAVAVAGQPLRANLAYEGGALTDLGSGPVATLRAERFVRTTGPALSDEIEVYHDRIREAVTARISATRLVDLHRRLARAMESDATVDAERIGRHFESAGVLDRATHHYAQAAERSVGALAFDRGAVLYRRAVDLRAEDDERKTQLMVRLAQALANAGRVSDAAEAYRIVADRVTGDERVELRHQAATQYCISGHVDEGRAMFGDLIRGVGLHVPTTTAGILSSLIIHRLQLRVRGLAATSRPGPEPARDLRRLDLLWSFSTGLSAVDVLGVAALQTRCLLLALRAGDPYRLARSLAWEAVLTSVTGSRGASRASALLARAESVAGSIDLPQARAVVLLGKGWSAFLQVRLRESLRCCDEAEGILRDHCTGVWWELGMLRTMATWALMHCGDFAGLAQVAPGFLRDATDRGDLFTKTNVATVGMAHLHLASDAPATAQRQVDEAMNEWPRSGFHMQHVAELFCTVNVLLYTGEGEQAYELISRAWPGMRRSLQLANQFNRVMMRDLRARSAIAAAERGRGSRMLRVAARDAARIRREKVPWAEPFGRRIEAALAAAGGHRDESIGLLHRAVAGFEAHDLGLHAAATRSRLGMMVAGSAGSTLLEEATRFMHQQSVRRVDRMTDMYVPRMTRLPL